VGLQRVEIIVPDSFAAAGEIIPRTVTDPTTATVEILAPRIGRVVDPKSVRGLRVDDIVTFSHEPSESDAPPILETLLPRKNPAESDVPYQTGGERNRLIALVAALGMEVLDVDQCGSPLLPELPLGFVTIAHPENDSLQLLAELAGLADTLPADGESVMSLPEERRGRGPAEAEAA
jgi:hypothetical protein